MSGRLAATMRGARPLRDRPARILLVVLAVALAVVATGLIVRTVRAQEPARWRPMLLAHASDVRPPPPPADGSADDRRELDAVVAAQTSLAVSALTIERWTTASAAVRWNEILLDTVRVARSNPVRTARALALLNAAMYDAVIAVCDAKLAYPRSAPAERDRRISTNGPLDDLSSYASIDAAIGAAAVAVLSGLDPGRARDFERHALEAERVRLAIGANTASDIGAGRSIGAAVGALALARGRSDGSDAVWPVAWRDEPGTWSSARAFRNDVPLEAMAGTWRPWLMASGSQFRPGPPPEIGSPQWQAETAEVERVNRELTDDQVRIARFWNDGPGTDTPPGHWVRIAIEHIGRAGLSTPDAVRVLAHLALAQADSFIACWDAKYHYWTERPIGRIPGFASTIVTPNFPAYVSGHSTVSGASAAVLSAFFPADAAAIEALAEEAAVSRLYGGIHWRSDNEVGLVVGRQVGELAVARARADGDLGWR